MQIKFFLPNKNAQKPSFGFNILRIMGEVDLQLHRLLLSCLLLIILSFLLLLLINVLKKLMVVIVLYRRDN